MAQDKENKSSGGNTTSQKKRKFRYPKKNNNKPKILSTNSSDEKRATAKEYKFHMHDAQARKTSESYDKIKKAMILKIQKTFENPLDIVQSLDEKKRKILSKPERRTSTADNEEDRVVENEMLREEYIIEFKIFKEDEKKFNDNWSRAYALIWENYCGKDMQLALEEMSEYESCIKNNPVELLKEIETLMHVP